MNKLILRFVNPNIATVTFIVNDTVYQIVKVRKNETVAKPAGDYTWYLGDTEYDFNTPVTENITLTTKTTHPTDVDIVYPDMESNTGIVYNYHGMNDAYIRDILIYDTLERFSSIQCEIVSNNELDRARLSYPVAGDFVLNSKEYQFGWSKEENQTILQFTPEIKKSVLKAITFTYIS